MQLEIMGAAASNTHRTGNENVDRTIQKMAVIGALQKSIDNSKVVKPHRAINSQKENIYDFVRKQKESCQDARAQLDKELEGDADDKELAVLPQEYDTHEEKEVDEKDLYDVQIQEEDTLVSNYCGVCKKPTRVTIDGWPCRVCGQTYHVFCIEKSPKYTKADLKLFDRASTSVGWSCEQCDNILNLLRTDEIDKLATDFEEFDQNKDSSVNLDEYLAFRKQRWEIEETGPMPPEEEAFQKLQFKLLDADGSGNIDYWEFVKNEACKNLARRSKEDLVKLLTPLEKQSAKCVYDMLDIDQNGVITEKEARVTLRGWYNHKDNKLKRPVGAGTKAGMLKPVRTSMAEQHAERQTSRLLDADEDGDRMVTWREFLRNQALYILSSRPNKVSIKW